MSFLSSYNVNDLIKKKKYDKLKKLISSKKEAIRYKTFLSLSQHVHDPQIEEILIPLLNDSDYLIKTLAIAKFRKFEGEENLANLDKALSLGTQSEKIEILKIVEEHVHYLGDDLTSFIVKALSDRYDSVVIEALKLAAKVKNLIIFETVVEKLKTQKHHIRCEVVKTLGEFGDNKSMNVLIDLLIDKNPQVRSVARETLIQAASAKGSKAKILKIIEESKVNLIIANLSGSVHDKVKALKEIEVSKLDFAIPYIEKLLADKYKHVRLEAVKTLGILNKPETMPLIAKLLRDDFWDVRREAIWALGKFNEKETLEYLETALIDKNKNIRAEAFKVIEAVKVRFARLDKHP